MKDSAGITVLGIWQEVLGTSYPISDAIPD